MAKAIILKIINAYQKIVSPVLGMNCRFYPTCSSYTTQAIRKYGLFKGLFLGIKRVMRCNAYFRGGVDEP